MAQVYTFTDANGEIRLMAEINPAPGGSPIQDREALVGAGVGINNGAAAFLGWIRDSGPALLDLADPTQPVVITAGVYAVSVTVETASPVTATGSFQAELDLDANGTTAKAVATASSSSTNGFPAIALAVTAYVPAGGVLFVYVNNFDGVQAVSFEIAAATVQRLS